MLDVIEFSKRLMSFKSITPVDNGAIDFLEKELKNLGFLIQRRSYEGVENIYAKYGSDSPNFCFAGHTDVVDPGNRNSWSVDPFSPEVKNDRLYGRGAVDMKAAIAAFFCASRKFIKDENFNGSISFLITGDEEGSAENGTQKILKDITPKIDHCLVGEPTNPDFVGQMVKNGRRGSVSFKLKVIGVQGHVAYPLLANNPVNSLINILHELNSYKFDEGNKYFDPTNLEITTIDIGNNTGNVIPESAYCEFNIRFNDEYKSSQLIEIITNIVKKYTSENNADYELTHRVSGESFITKEGDFTDILLNSIKEFGLNPVLSTTGGTSDARFIKDYCQVAEFGLINQTAHKIDENIEVKELQLLEKIYYQILKNYFK